jgi:hypothetical protein
MKTLLWALGMFALSIGLVAAEEKAPPTMPSEVTLTSGRVLRKVQVVRWEKERVVLKHMAGVDPVHFSLIKSISMADLLSMQAAAATKSSTKSNPQTSEPAKPMAVQVTGVAFDRGVNQPYIFAGLRIVVMPAGTITSGRVPDSYHFAKDIVTETITDPKGEFMLEAAPGNYQVMAIGTRHYRHGATRAVYRWLIEMDTRTTKKLVLNKENSELGVDVLR